MKRIFLEDENKTKELGEKLGKLVDSGSIICLVGDLGAGKTTFTQSFAKSLGVDDYITSPTFTIVNEYQGRCSEEMYDIGYDEYINSDGVCIIEWANLIEDILPDEYLKIDMKYKEMGREVTFEPVGEKYEKMIEEMNL